MASIVILSPHFDDAVFSCWHLLTKPGTTVITIFAGTPAGGTTTWWDRLCGESDSVAMVRKRIHENEAALSDIGVSCRNLPYVDRQYSYTNHDVPELANAILSQVDHTAAFFAPLAGSRVWRHPDHITVREVGKFLLAQGKKVSFYADLPYMQMPIRPSDRYKHRVSQRASRLIGTPFVAQVSELNARNQTLKRKAMHQYESQYKMTNIFSLGTLGRHANIGREMVFHVA